MRLIKPLTIPSIKPLLKPLLYPLINPPIKPLLDTLIKRSNDFLNYVVGRNGSHKIDSTV